MTAIGRAVLNYFGSKVSTAHKYPYPVHRTIIEPFAGGAGYSLCYWDRDVILCDLNPDVVTAWRYVIETDADEILKLPLIEPGQKVQDLGLSAGAEMLIRWCVNTATASPCNRLRSNAIPYLKLKASHWGEARRKQIANTATHIKHWRLILGDYTDVPDIVGTWFIDPPYQGAGHNYKFGSDRIDYAQLADWSQSRRGQVIVCENEDADWLPFKPLIHGKPGATLDAGKVRRKTEVVWLGGDGEDVAAQMEMWG